MYKYWIIFLLLSPQYIFAQDVVINEIMASNDTTIYDEDQEASDWIELYNRGSEEIDLSGYSLSDDTLDIQKWKFENTTIEPGEYLIVFASGKDRKTTNLHTNFKISASGERILLSDTSGAIIDQVDVPASPSDVSYARINDGSLPWIFQYASPGYRNTGNEFEGFADTVSVSLPGGFYPSAISVVLSAGDSRIYYTLDGSDPDSTSAEYSTPINIQHTTVLKAISVKANHRPAPTVYHTYFINENTELPVVSLSSDPYNLFDYYYGIYANGPGWTPNPPNHGANFWMDWERPAHIEFFDDDKNLGFSENCGISIYGAYTRSFPQKAFSVKFKDIYGKTKLEYPLFPGFRVTTFKSFLLRNSGNDFQYTHIRDAMMQTLVKDLDIDYLEYRPATTFINGQYWGIYNIREKISEHYIAYRHGIDPDNVDLLEGNMTVLDGDSLHYRRLIDYITTHNMATDEAYNYVDSTIDLDECLLYFAAQVYYNSQDWPANNLKYWRERSEKGKWRWILFDLDFGFNLYENTGQSEDHVYYLFSGIETRPGSNPPWSTLLPRKLVENPRIKNQFINLVADLLNTNFKIDRVLSTIDNMANHIAGEIGRHRQRWGIDTAFANYHLRTRMPAFARERPGYLRGFMRNFFGCGNDGSVTINSTNGGKIKLNSLYFTSNDLPWSGVYFQGNAVHLKAIPEPGYKFDGWSGTITSEDVSLTLSVTGSTNIHASFSIDSSVAKEIVINEISYNPSDSFATGDWVELYNRSSRAIDISDWFFTDSDAGHKFTFPAGTVLEPDRYLVLVEDNKAFTSLFPDVVNYIGEMGFGLNGTGEFVKLADNEDQVIDTLTYDDEVPWPAAADGLGATLELVDPASDNAKAENWQASTGHGSPGHLNTVPTSTEEINREKIPEKFLLFQNYPNPFNPITKIEYSIPKRSLVTLKISDILGRELAVLVDEQKLPGTYKNSWDASPFPSGVYFCNLKAGSYSQTKKLLLLK